MANDAPLWSLCISITSIFLSAICAIACWSAVSRCTRLMSALREVQRTPTSAARFETLEAEQAEFASSLQKLSSTVKRLSSRYGMADLRERRSADQDEEPPVGASKATLRLWAQRKVGAPIGAGPDFARQQLKLERMSED